MSEGSLESSVEATREPSFLLAKPEKRLLQWIARRLPRWILPDDLTALGVLAAIGIGLGLSPLMLLSIGTLIVVAYLILSINVYLESFAFGRFSIGYGYVGPTEIRLILIALNTVVALGAGLDFVVADLQLTVFDVIGLAIAATMIALLLGRAARNLRELARKEPAAPRR